MLIQPAKADRRSREMSGACQTAIALTAAEHRDRLQEAAGLIVDGLSATEAAELAGVIASEIPEPNGATPYVPSPASIAAGCIAVQSGWSEEIAAVGSYQWGRRGGAASRSSKPPS